MLQIDLTGKRALVMGVTNKHSLGWAIASRLREAGAYVASMTPGPHPFDELETALQRVAVEPVGSLLERLEVGVSGEAA